MRFIKYFVAEKDFLKRIRLERFIFRLLEEKNSQPISMTIEFCEQKKYFVYKIEISTERIDKEELYLSGLGDKENELIFSRNGNTFKTASEETSNELKEAREKLLKANPFSSFLSLNQEFPLLKDKNASLAFGWFKNRLDIIKVNTKALALIEMLSAHKKLLSFMNDTFVNLGIGIKQVKVSSKSFDQWITEESGTKSEEIEKFLQKKSMESNSGIVKVENNRSILSVSVENGARMVKELLFEQLGKNGYVGEMDIRAQSDGTARLLTLIPAFYDAIKQNSVVFIDEIDNSIHPTLMKALIEFFSKTDSNGQLIFTTHETCLLNQQDLMRPDEVWFTEKFEGSTRMYSLNDFKQHNTISIEKGYLLGRYGAIPFIGSLE
jgi:hypothetical protein